ncbi:hypothetical protein ACFWPX_30090 [Nocardia sp. NPDC058518]|uniref:hypothetical protein n=1 Tax=Nocardia sp. NPDC058518 TaxID=3346534 RepID=UPI003668494B
MSIRHDEAAFETLAEHLYTNTTAPWHTELTHAQAANIAAGWATDTDYPLLTRWIDGRTDHHPADLAREAEELLDNVDSQRDNWRNTIHPDHAIYALSALCHHLETLAEQP